MAAERALAERIEAVEQGMVTYQERLDQMAVTLIGLGDDVTQQGISVRTLTGQTSSAVDQVNEQFDNHQKALIQVVEHARNEFEALRNGLNTLYGGTGQTFVQLQEKVNDMAQELADLKTQGTATGNEKKTHGFLPLKEQVPKSFGLKENDWRTWQDDVATYLDTVTGGMRDALKQAELATSEVDDAWLVHQTTTHGAIVMGKSRELHRALKTLTEGEARMVVQGVKDERGFEAWRLLHMRFGLSTAAKQGQVMADVITIAQKPCKSPADTRARVIELERRVRIAEDVTGKPLDDSHIKSVLAAVLDPITRAHTTTLMGAGFGYQALKRGVLEFAANNAVAAGSTKLSEASAMDIGHLGQSTADEPEPANAEQDWEDGGEHLGAVSHSTQCFNCKGYGHMSSQCPSAKGKGKGVPPGSSKGKGKNSLGKGQQKGNPKGKGKGPIKGCWTCGGPHFAQDCPAAYSKGGKGYQKGAYSFEEWPLPAQQGVRFLGSITTSNRFEALAGDDEPPNDQELQKTMPMGPSNIARITDEQSKKVGKCEAKSRWSSSSAAACSGGCCSGRRGHAMGHRLADFCDTDCKSGAISYKAAVLESLNPLSTIEPANLCPISEHEGWEVIDLAVDSGASETVIPANLVQSVGLTPSDASKRGVQYEVANGERIPNLGEKAFTGYTDKEGYCRGIRAQVCDVSKPLLSVSRLVKAGNAVVFAPTGSFVEDGHTGERIMLEEQGGMYNMRLWVPSSSPSTPGF